MPPGSVDSLGTGWTRATARSCLVDAPDGGAAATVHREAHGLVVDEIYQVQEGS
jgi:hypothetical protein